MLPVYKAVRKLHEALYIECKRRRLVLRGNPDLTEVADDTLLIRKAVELLEDSAKELKSLSQNMSDNTAMVCLTTGDAVPNGRYARAHLKASFAVYTPSFSKAEEYGEVCKALGVENSPLTRLHFPTIKKMVTERLEKGERLPPALEKLQQESVVKLVAVTSGDPDKDLAKSESLL